MNAFELISTSQGLNLGTLFEKQTGSVKRETRFASRLPANEILSKIEAAAGPMGFNVQKRNYKLKLQGENPGRKGQLAIATEVQLPGFSRSRLPCTWLSCASPTATPLNSTSSTTTSQMD
ncbi:CBL-interacting serine/threonine-protein kinase 23 [Zea mays]|uniref:non-specific serine/threonine protein kinase n=1 Tax=Zea mays TaxID=4577 RepID=A0A1D6HSH9_MAIZE|nr:CBL-interacting serine/threonine-protein kinase 23 [Zea mays]